MNSRSGIVLVLIGAALLAHNFGLIHWGWLRQWWPVLLIALGLWIIVRPTRFHQDPGSRRPPGEAP